MLIDQPQLKYRETLILTELPTERTLAEIAKTLSLNYETVRDIVDRLRRKIGLRNRSGLAVWAVRNSDWLQQRMAELAAEQAEKAADKRRQASRRQASRRQRQHV